MAVLMRYLAAILALLVISSPGWAQWHQGEGQARVIDKKLDAARQQAIQNALVSLMYSGGASIQAVQVVKSGVLETQELIVKTQGEVHGVKVLQEQQVGDQLKVLVAADIYPLGLCSSGRYAKPLHLGPIQLKQYQQAQLGGLYRLPEQITQRLYGRFSHQQKLADVRGMSLRPLPQPLSVIEQLTPQEMQQLVQWTEWQQAQYLLLGSIEDLSTQLQEQSGSLLGLGSSESVLRNFKLKIALIDSVSEELVFTQTYQGQREWPFARTLQLNPEGEAFWATAYGQLINQLLERIVRDIEGVLYCRQSLATISAVNEKGVVINLGRSSGVQVGDRLRLAHRQHILNQTGVSHPIVTPSQVYFRVSKVQAQQAFLAADDAADLANVQVRDLLMAEPVEFYPWASDSK